MKTEPEVLLEMRARLAEGYHPKAIAGRSVSRRSRRFRVGLKTVNRKIKLTCSENRTRTRKNVSHRFLIAGI
jgi:hypothetical protein